MSSCFSSAPMPGRPTTSAAYFARRDFPASNNCSCARAIAARLAPLEVVVGSSRRSEPAMFTVPVDRTSNPFAQTDLRGVPDFGARAGDVEGAALREEVDAPAVQRRLDAEGG